MVPGTVESPHLLLSPGYPVGKGALKDKERGNRLLQKTEKNCLGGRSLTCPIVLEPALIITE
jgi:hypothetical protein